MQFFTKSYGKQNKRVLFLLAGWHTRMWMYVPFLFIFQRHGFYCITYTYTDDVFSTDTNQTISNFISIRDDVVGKIVKLKEVGYEDFSVFGTSLGSLLAIMIAHKSPEVSKIVLNTTTVDIARTVWTWNHIKSYFKQELVQQHLTLQKLEKVWASISPEHNIDNLKGKRFLVFLSRKDQIMPYSLGRELVTELAEHHYKYQLIKNSYLGHGLTCYYNLLNSRVYLKFLNSH